MNQKILNNGLVLNLESLSAVNYNLSTHYIIYRIDNINTKQYYIGQHITNNAEDSYEGSGLYLNNAQKCYGLSSFIKSILFDFDNFEDMNKKEMELVQLSNCYPYDSLSYNLKEGGARGSITEQIKQKIRQTKDLHKEQISKSMSDAKKKYFTEMTEEEYLLHIERMRKNGLFDLRGENHPMYGEHLSDYMSASEYEQWHIKIKMLDKSYTRTDEYRQRYSEKFSGENNPMYGKSIFDFMTEEEIKQWRENVSKATSGQNNPMYGKNVKDLMTEDKYQEMLLHRSQSLKGKNKGKIVMRHTTNLDIIAVNPDEVKEKENIGYIRYSLNKGKRKMINYNTNEIVWINVDQINDYVKLGYTRPIRSRHKK